MYSTFSPPLDLFGDGNAIPPLRQVSREAQKGLSAPPAPKLPYQQQPQHPPQGMPWLRAPYRCYLASGPSCYNDTADPGSSLCGNKRTSGWVQ